MNYIAVVFDHCGELEFCVDWYPKKVDPALRSLLRPAEFRVKPSSLSEMKISKCCLLLTLSMAATKNNLNRGVFDTIIDVHTNLSRTESLQKYQKERSE